MRKHSLTATARHLLAHAATASSGRSAETVYGGHEHVLRHTLIALMQGRSLAEHDSEGEATIYVIRGRVRLTNDDAHWDGMAGDLLEWPPSGTDLKPSKIRPSCLAWSNPKRWTALATGEQRPR